MIPVCEGCADRLGRYDSVQASARNLFQAKAAEVAVKSGIHVLDLRLSVTRVVEQVTVSDTPGDAVGTAAAENANALILRGQDLDALSDNPDDLQADLQVRQVGYGRVEILTKLGAVGIVQLSTTISEQDGGTRAIPTRLRKLLSS